MTSLPVRAADFNMKQKKLQLPSKELQTDENLIYVYTCIFIVVYLILSYLLVTTVTGMSHGNHGNGCVLCFCFRLTDGNEYLFQAKDEVSLTLFPSLNYKCVCVCVCV